MKIRRYALFAAAFALTAAPAYAQKMGEKAPAGEARLTIGPFFGVSMSTIAGDSFQGSSNHTGLMAGGMLQHNSPSGMFFRIGAKYSQRGAEASAAGATAKIKLAYLEVPAVVGYELGAPGRMRPYLYGGGQVALRMSCDVEASFGGISASATCDSAQMKAKSTDFGLLVGGGLSIPSGRGSILLDVRYLLGMQDAFEMGGGKNRGFTLGFGYLFPLGR